MILEVLGMPAPKGSNRAMVFGGKARFIPGGSKTNQANLKSWDGAVREAAALVVGNVIAPPFVETALTVEILFRLARPGGHWGKGKNAGKLAPSAPAYPRGKPDIDKLARATLDSLTGIVFDDDSRIVALNLRKVYAVPGNEGATITIDSMDLVALNRLARTSDLFASAEVSS